MSSLRQTSSNLNHSKLPTGTSDGIFTHCSKQSAKNYDPIPSPVKYNFQEALKAQKLFLNHKGNFRDINLSSIQKEWRPGLLHLAIGLDAHYRAFNDREEIELVISSLLRPDMSDFLKKRKFISFIESFGLKTFEPDESYSGIPRKYFGRDSGTCFHYNHSFFYEEEVDDYKYGLIDCNCNPEYLERFREILANLLKDIEFKQIPMQEILLRSGGEMCFYGGKSIPLYKLDYARLGLSGKRGLAKRVVIPVSPGNMRDAILNQPEDLFRILAIEYNLDKILEENFLSFIDDKDPTAFSKKYEKFVRKGNYFLCRDFKKEGITKPKELIKVMLEELYKVTGCYAFEVTDYFDNFDLLVDGQVLKMKRGHGLGMGNSLTTLMQIALVFLIDSEISFENDSPSFITHNDDIILSFKDSESLQNFWDAEDIVCKELSLIRNPKKSFWGKSGVFLEVYNFMDRILPDSFHDEIELLSTFKCVNVTHAKHHYNSIKKHDDSILFELILTFGYEFFEDEHLYPFRFGGWVGRKHNGISLDLLDLDKLPYSDRVCRAYIAQKESIYKSQGKGCSSVSHFDRIADAKIEDEFSHMFVKGCDEWKSFIYGRRSLSNQKTFDYWEKLKKKRMTSYESPFSLPFNQFIDKVYKERDEDLIPLPSQIDKEIYNVTFLDFQVEDHYKGQYARLNYLSSISDGYDNFYPEKYSLRLKFKSPIGIKDSDFFKTIRMYEDKKGPPNIYVYPNEEDYILSQERLFNPQQYFTSCFELFNSVLIPKKEISSDIGNYRKDVYGNYLPYFSIFYPKIGNQFLIRTLFFEIKKEFLEQAFDEFMEERSKKAKKDSTESESSDSDDPMDEQVVLKERKLTRLDLDNFLFPKKEEKVEIKEDLEYDQKVEQYLRDLKVVQEGWKRSTAILLRGSRQTSFAAGISNFFELFKQKEIEAKELDIDWDEFLKENGLDIDDEETTEDIQEFFF